MYHDYFLVKSDISKIVESEMSTANLRKLKQVLNTLDKIKSQIAISTDPLDIEAKKVISQPFPSSNDGQYTQWSHDVLNIVVKRVVNSEYKKY